MEKRQRDWGITQPIRGMGEIANYTELVGHVVRLVHSLLSSHSRLHGDFMVARLAHIHLHDVSHSLNSVHNCIYDLREHSAHTNSDHVDGIAELTRVLKSARHVEARHFLWVAQECISHSILLAQVPSHDHATLLQLKVIIAIEFDDHDFVADALHELETANTQMDWLPHYACRAHLMRFVSGHGTTHDLEQAAHAAVEADHTHRKARHVGYAAARALLLHGLTHGGDSVPKALRLMSEHFLVHAEEFMPVDAPLHELLSSPDTNRHAHLSSSEQHQLAAWIGGGVRAHGPALESALHALHGASVTT